MADISKIKLATGDIVTLKDAEGRGNMKTLLGGHALGALGAAAWKAVAANISGEGLVDAATVKAYVDKKTSGIATDASRLRLFLNLMLLLLLMVRNSLPLLLILSIKFI